MAYVALYRSYRPTNFSDVVGQKHIIKTLKNAVIENKTSHAYIFSGLRGIGKTTIARILAKAVNCENSQDGEPCNSCKSCLSIINDETTDIVELDAASNNGVDEMREILEKVNFLPSLLRKKVYIIDEAHMLSSAAFNALLKTLEEPPTYVMFILATTEPHKIPQTILSRCQRFDFKQLSIDELVYQLKVVCEKEQIKIDDEALNIIAESAEGGMRDALSILDQASVYSTDVITVDDVDNVTGRISKYKLIELIKALKEKDANRTIHLIDELINMGKEASRIVSSLIQFCRDVLLYKNVYEYDKEKNIYKNSEFIELSKEFTETEIFYYIDVLVDIQNKIKFTNSQKIYLEVGLLKIVNLAEENINIIGKIKDIESKMNIKGDGTSSNLDVDVKIANIENKIKKVAIDLEKADLVNFKEKMESKMELIEDISSKNATIPTDIIMRFDSIEDRLRVLSVDVQDSNMDEFKELVDKVKQIENNIKNKEDNSENNIGNNQNQDIELILEQLVSLESKVNSLEEKNDNNKNIESNNYDEEFLKLQQELEKLKSKMLIIENESSANDIVEQQLFGDEDDNKKQIQSLLEKVEQLEIRINNQNQELEDIKYDQLNKEILELKNKVENIIVNNISDVDNNLDKDIYQKVQKLESTVQILLDEPQSSLNNEQYYEEVIQLKENYFSIIEKIQQMMNTNSQDELEKINLKVEEVQNQAELLKEKIIKIEKDVENKIEEINKIKTSVIINNKQVEKQNIDDNKEYSKPIPKPQIIETNETKTLQTVKNVYDVRIVERILHESRELECREEKGRLISNWSKLEDKVGYVLSPIAKMLLDGKLVANGKKELLIVYPSATICNHLMEPKNTIDAKQVLRITFGKDYDFLALPENTWQEKRTEYIGQHSIGIRYPKLTPIKNPELNVIIPNYEQINQKQKRPLQQAKAFFGGLVVEEEN